MSTQQKLNNTVKNIDLSKKDFLLSFLTRVVIYQKAHISFVIIYVFSCIIVEASNFSNMISWLLLEKKINLLL